MASSSFRHFATGSRVLYGDDCLGQLPAELRRTGSRRAVVFCGRTLAGSTPGLETVREALGDLYAGVFAGVAEQSPINAVEAAVAELRKCEADAIVAIGGGSAVVTARAAAIIHGEERGVEDLCTVFRPGAPPQSPKLSKPKLPQFVVSTTPTTAYAKSGAAVTIPGEGRRLALFDPKARVQALFIHPAFLAATPWPLVLDAALDAFAQGVQGLESVRRQPLADALLIHGVRLIHDGLAAAEATEISNARRDLMVAAQLIGEGTDQTGAGLASALGHAIGARFGGGNGRVKAIILPHAIAFNGSVTGTNLDALALALGSAQTDPASIAQDCRQLFASLALPMRLRDLGLPKEALGQIADDAFQDWFLSQNPRQASLADLTHILEAAW